MCGSWFGHMFSRNRLHSSTGAGIAEVVQDGGGETAPNGGIDVGSPEAVGCPGVAGP